MLSLADAAFDRLEAIWAGERARRYVAALLAGVFGVALLGVELARRGLLPEVIARRAPHSHFAAIEVAFYLLLAFEVVGLVLGIARSVSNAAGKQLEIFSLILLRHSFEEFGHVPEPFTWAGAREVVYRMLADGFGALVVFVLLGFYYAAQRHLPFSLDPGETRRFVAMKKALALVLVAVFTANAGRALLSESPEFFESFYTVLVFADVLIVLLSLRYSPSYAVVFRNSGLAVATVLLRLALSAPAFANAALGVAAAAFALGLTLAYHRVAPVLGREEGRGPREQLAAAPAAGAAQSNPVSPTPSSPG